MASRVHVQLYCLTVTKLIFQVTISGIFRGVGKQYLAAIINFLCYNVIGLSVGIPLALKADLGTIGLWAGLAMGNVIQVS